MTGFDLRRIRKFRQAIAAKSAGPLKPVFKRWGVRYLAWTKQLFVKNSRGGGDWPPLKSISYKRALGSRLRATRGGRRRGRRAQQRMRGRMQTATIAILRDTGTLFKALTIGAPGNLFQYIVNGIRVGFGGPAKHPQGKATIADIAEFHQTGDPKRHLPARPILHIPNESLKKKMLDDLAKGIDRIGRGLSA